MRKLRTIPLLIVVSTMLFSCQKENDVELPIRRSVSEVIDNSPSVYEVLIDLKVKGFYTSIPLENFRFISSKEYSLPKDLESFILSDEFFTLISTKNIASIADKCLELDSYKSLGNNSRDLFQKIFRDQKFHEIFNESILLATHKGKELRSLPYGQFYDARAVAGMSPEEKKRLLKTLGNGIIGYLGGPFVGAITMGWSFISEYALS